MEYSPFLPEVKENPYPYYADLRQHAPVYPIPDTGLWAISRYDEVLYVFKNPQLFSSSAFFPMIFGDLNPFPPQAPPMISCDPPDHTRLRKLVNRAFTPRRIASLESHIGEVVRQLIEQMATHSTCDLVRDFSAPLPVIVMAELLGVEPERQQDFKRWTNDIIFATQVMGLTSTDRARILQSIADFRAYFEAAIVRYRRHPGDNLVSDLVRAEEENQTLTADEVLTMAVFLLLAGNETTTNLIGSAVVALLAHPQQLAKVRANPALIRQAVEETLRYESPIQLIPRQTTQDVEIAETVIPAGSLVLPLIGSANRDGRIFPDPDRFDITRDTEGHLAFSFGIHYCLGAQLARLEGKIALQALLARFSHLARRDDLVTLVESAFVRGPKTLPLTFA